LEACGQCPNPSGKRKKHLCLLKKSTKHARVTLYCPATIVSTSSNGTTFSSNRRASFLCNTPWLDIESVSRGVEICVFVRLQARKIETGFLRLEEGLVEIVLPLSISRFLGATFKTTSFDLFLDLLCSRNARAFGWSFRTTTLCSLLHRAGMFCVSELCRMTSAPACAAGSEVTRKLLSRSLGSTHSCPVLGSSIVPVR
jgi:hypothetical protein